MPAHGAVDIRARRARTSTAGCLAALLLFATACVTGQREPPPEKFWCPDGGWENGGMHCLTEEDWCKQLVHGMRLILQWKNECVATDVAWCFDRKAIPSLAKRFGMECHLTRQACDYLFDIRGLESECFPFREVRVYEGLRRRY